MKKIILALVVLALAIPASAEVLITCVQVDTGPSVIVSYMNGEAEPVRAFALEIILDEGTIVAVSCLSSDYYIFPGSINIVDGDVEDWGECAIVDGNVAIIEMGSLYAAEDACHPAAPPDDGNLVLVTVSGNCNISIKENELRGGVVMETPEDEPDVNAPGCTVDVECYSGMADYDQWVLVGKPICWCYPRQCLGDADGLPYGKNNYWVATPDLTILKSAWGKTAAQLTGNEACADFDHLPYGKNLYRVSTPDLIIMKNNWGIANGPAGTCLPGNEAP